jgi:hypothetical protein
MMHVDILESMEVAEIRRNIPCDENIIKSREGLELLSMVEKLCKFDEGNRVFYRLLHKKLFVKIFYILVVVLHTENFEEAYLLIYDNLT